MQSSRAELCKPQATELSCKLSHSRALIHSRAELCEAAKPSPAADAAEICILAGLDPAVSSERTELKSCMGAVPSGRA